jgi:nitrogen regulatory protein PII-like uncharacterized protein
LNLSTKVLSNFNSSGISGTFVNKLDSAGNYLWGKSFGGADEDQSAKVVLDNANKILLIGTFINTSDFDPDGKVANTSTIGNNQNILISKFDKKGNFT